MKSTCARPEAVTKHYVTKLYLNTAHDEPEAVLLKKRHTFQNSM